MDVSVPSGSPEASAWSIMWFSSLTPMLSMAGSASRISLRKRSSPALSMGV